MSIIQNSCLTCKYRIRSKENKIMLFCSKNVSKEGELICNCMEYDPYEIQKDDVIIRDCGEENE